jgi:hypothetical protein
VSGFFRCREIGGTLCGESEGSTRDREVREKKGNTTLT